MARRPTPLQRRAFKAIMANDLLPTPKPLGTVLREAGYSKSISTTPGEVMKGKGLKALMDRAGISEEYLTEKLRDGLEATKRYGKDGDIVDKDYAIRHKYLETSLKLRGVQVENAQSNAPIYNTQINQTNIDPNSPEAKKIIENTLDILMNQTLAE